MHRISKLLLICFSLVIFSSLTSAAGLTLIQSDVQVNKSIGEDVEIQLQLRNEEPFDFFNVSFDTNNIIEMDKIPVITSGETIEFTAKVKTNENLQEQIRIKGLKKANIGGENKEYDIFLTFDGDNYFIDRCNLPVLKGDNVTWHNDAGVTVDLIKWPEHTPIKEIGNGQTFKKQFPSEQNYNYYFSIRSFPITPVCTINIVGDEGLINDPELDALLNLKVDIIAEPTTIQVTIPETNYTIEVGKTDEGVLTIRNIGNDDAVNVKLSGEWFEFSANEFNIREGEQKGIIYTIRPVNLQTEDTNKTHTINLKITGNFNTFEQELKVFIPYKIIIDGGEQEEQESFVEFVKRFCKENPEVCDLENLVEYVYVNNVSDAEFNVTLKNQQFLDFLRSQTADSDAFQTLVNFMKENEGSDQDWKQTIAEQVLQNKEYLDGIQEEQTSRTKTYGLLMIALFAFMIVGVSGFLIYRRKLDDDIGRYKTWQMN